MWSDNETDVDLLQFKYIATSVTRLIKSKHLLPTTIGVFGDWGSGKSSLLKMVEKEISQESGTITISFNGWLFEGFEDAKTALMGTILEKIEERIKADKNLLQKAGDLLSKLSKRVNWFQLLSLTGRYALPALVGMPHVSAINFGADTAKTVIEKAKGIDVNEAKKLLKAAPGGEENIRRNIREFRSDFAKLLEASEIETLVVFVDDLDRCMPDTVIETLEAIKLFLFVPGTVFVLGADERLIEYAVRRRFPELPGTDAEVGRDYLEKLIQIPVRIPPLSGAENHSYINLLFAQSNLGEEDFDNICTSVSNFKPDSVSDLSFDIEICRSVMQDKTIPQQLEYDLDLTAQVAPVLTPGLGGNPRRTKRFLNMLLLRMQMGEDRGLKLRRPILAKLMLLEYLKPEFFKQLARLQANQEGEPKELTTIEETFRVPTKLLAGENEDIEKMPAASEDKTAKLRTGKTMNAVSRSKDIKEANIPADIEPWLADEWMKKWLSSEPILAGVDLRPYFYIAHDSIGSLGTSQTRLSPKAKQVMDKLLNSGTVTQKLGLKMVKDLGSADVSAVFENLAQRVRQAETLEQSPQKVLFSLMAEQPDLTPQLVTLYASLPETKITMGTVPALFQAVKETPGSLSATKLFERWAKSSNNSLANAAKAVLKRLNNL
jgi:hypothetical protein